MVKRSKLKSALDAEKGVDYRAEHQKRVRKQAGKGKKLKGSEAEESHDDEALEPHEGVDANAAVSFLFSFYMVSNFLEEELVESIVLEISLLTFAI